MPRERLQKALSAAGVTSRRKAEDLITSGHVMVNGKPAVLGQSVDRVQDVIEIRGHRVEFPAEHTYLALHKPVGFVTSARSTHGESNVMALVDCVPRVFPVGRLDKDTSGLLLFSDDGDWANIASHPRYMVEKEYDALVEGRVEAGALERLRLGVHLPDGTQTAPATVVVRGHEGQRTRLSVTVIEGKKRQIRLMAEAVGHPLLRLARVRVGTIELSDLGAGR